MLLQSVAQELGFEISIVIESDAAAAIAAAEKRGLLRFKHLAIRWLFLKELIDRKTIIWEKVKSADMCADFLTKPIDEQTLKRNLGVLERASVYRVISSRSEQTCGLQTERLPLAWGVLRRRDQGAVRPRADFVLATSLKWLLQQGPTNADCTAG